MLILPTKGTNFKKPSQLEKNVKKPCLADEHFASKHILLFGNTFAEKNSLLQIGLLQFTPQHTLPHGMFSCLEHFAPQPPLHLRTLCSLTLFAARNTLLLNTFCSLEPFAPQHHFLPGTLCS